MRGRIIRFVSDRQFGFIAGSDDQEYFFHRTVWMETEAPQKGDLVNFTPSRSQKGLRAKNVQRLMEEAASKTSQAFRWEQIDRMPVTESDTPKKGAVIAVGEEIFVQNSDCSVADVREELKTLAANHGANALLNFRYERHTGSSGNYRYTIHRVIARPAYVGIKKPCFDDSQEVSSRSELELAAQGMVKAVANLAEDQRRKERLSDMWSALWTGTVWSIIALVFFAMLSG